MNYYNEVSVLTDFYSKGGKPKQAKYLQWVFVITLAVGSFGTSIASGEDNATDSSNSAEMGRYAECEKVLLSPPANELAARSRNGTYGELTNKYLGPHLFGKVCSQEQIINYLSDAGWIPTRNPVEKYSKIRETFDYSYDKVLRYCLPERGLWRLFNKCGGGAYVYFINDRLTWISFGVPIRFGG